MEFEINGKYTIIGISEMLAMTYRQEITITGLTFRDKSNRYTFKERKKRKEFYLDEKDEAVFKGWDIPLLIDSEQKAESNGFVTSYCRGNACFNFVGNPEEIKAYLEQNQLNPKFQKEFVLAIEGKKETVVYPELAECPKIMDKVRNQEKTLFKAENQDAKTYTVTQEGGYQILRTTDKLEAEKKLTEMLKSSDRWYICEQGKESV